MERRKFIRNTGLTAVGIGVFGSIRWEDEKFVGDTATTTDILGPFYRPNAPVRVNINPPGYKGKLFHLSGSVFREDGKTPFSGGQVEIWQCDEHKVYDNTSDDFRYRGSQRVDKNGKYHFTTTHPVPYPLSPNSSVYRPAHIHLRISGEGQQDLITQIYFEDDPHLKADPSSNSPEAINRILTVKKNSKGEEMVSFNVVMLKEFKPGADVYKKIAGIYEMNDDALVEFYQAGDMLIMKRNGQIVEGLSYKGNNSFEGGAAGTNRGKATFEIMQNGVVKVKLEFHSAFANRDYVTEGAKSFKY